LAVVAAALAAEGEADALPGLPTTVKRKHVHFTHVRTAQPGHRQPETFTRAEFWEHLRQVYAEAYPVANAIGGSGSILAFGIVVKERHAAAPGAADRHEHHHAAVFCSVQHYWNKVAKISLEKHQVPLNAVAHSGYTEMYAYLRRPSKKKPLSELDAEPYLSEHHPRDEALQQLLEAGSMSQCANGARNVRCEKRERAPSIFELVKDKRVRTVTHLQELACAEAAAGRTALADYCTRQGHKLADLLSHAWAVVEAPQRCLELQLTRVQKLQRAASQLVCECGGRWAQGATFILQNNGIDVNTFCLAVCRALELGAARGTNISITGLGGCGKSALLEPLEKCFPVAAKPQAGSTFPLANVLHADLILWQDYEHDEKTLRFTDLLSLFVGETVGVRLPGQLNQQYKNRAPTFYSGREPIRSSHRQAAAAREQDRMMSERFTLFHFTRPLPHEMRDAAWRHCGRCAAAWYLQGLAGARERPQPRPAPAASSSSSAELIRGLLQLTTLRQSGLLDEEEFRAAKRQMLHLGGPQVLCARTP